MNYEVCAANLQSALAAQEAGAHRIELCSALDVGGLTPSWGLIRATVRHLTIPVHVLIRPREGDFCYSKMELDLMLDDVRACREMGVAGVVVGALHPSGELDLPTLEALKNASDSLDVSCHRALDFCPDPIDAVHKLVGLGFTRLLSSGQASSAFEGRFCLKKMVAAAHGRMSVMPGGGITAQNIGAIAECTGAQDFHFSGRKKIAAVSQQSPLPGLDMEHWESDVSLIRAVMAAHAKQQA